MDGTEASIRERERERGRKRRARGCDKECATCGAVFHAVTSGRKYCDNCQRNRTSSCVDCGCTVHSSGARWILPKRCPPCRAKRQRETRRINAAKSRAADKERRKSIPRIPKSLVCIDCKTCFQWNGNRGKPPARCRDCGKQKKNQQKIKKEYSLQCQKCRCEFVSVGSPQRKLCEACLLVHREAEQASCEYCGNAFDRWKQGGRSYGRFCCQSCYWAARRKQQLAAQVRKLEAKFQKNYAAAVSKIRKAVERERNASKPWPCLQCGKLFRNGRDRLCSYECRRLAFKRSKKQARKGRVAHGHRERCRLRGLPFDSSVSRAVVFERDGCVCLLCGRHTVEGDQHMAPTIGHIVPLKNPLNRMHGHTMENTFTNCASCNGRQGNAVVIDGHQNHENPRATLLESIRSTGYPFEALCRETESPACPQR